MLYLSGQCDFHEDMCGLVNTGSGSVNKWVRAQSEEFALSKNTTVPSTDSTGDANGYFAVVAGRAYSTYFATFLTLLLLVIQKLIF